MEEITEDFDFFGLRYKFKNRLYRSFIQSPDKS